MIDPTLKEAERAADRYDYLGAPMTFYQPHVAEMRARAGLSVDPMLRATRETQGQRIDAAPVEVRGEPYMPTGE